MEFTKRDTKFIKGVAICLMLYHHLFAFPERVTEGVFISLWSFNDTNLSVCLGAFGRICVPLFTLMSGYGRYYMNMTYASIGYGLLGWYLTAYPARSSGGTYGAFTRPSGWYFPYACRCWCTNGARCALFLRMRSYITFSA